MESILKHSRDVSIKIKITTPNALIIFKFVSLGGTFIKMSIIANTILLYN